MRRIQSSEIGKIIYDSILDISFNLPKDVKSKIHNQLEKEDHPTAKSILGKFEENFRISEDKKIPLCQDTGMFVVFMDIGQDVAIEGEYIETTINAAVAKAYEDAYLRKSVVDSPLKRINTQNNTPAIIHYRVVPGESIRLNMAVKGFGSENMSRLKMLKPSDGVEGVIDFVVESVKMAGPNPCPPIIVGVGIGGTMEKAALMSKRALMREIDSVHMNDEAKVIEEELYQKINALDIGPMGMGGITTALGVFVEMYPTHIAGLPVAVNINCHSSRHKEVVL